MLGNVMDTLAKPSMNMSWLQLAAATVFVLVVAVAWRQIVLYIAGEM